MPSRESLPSLTFREVLLSALSFDIVPREHSCMLDICEFSTPRPLEYRHVRITQKNVSVDWTAIAEASTCPAHVAARNWVKLACAVQLTFSQRVTYLLCHAGNCLTTFDDSVGNAVYCRRMSKSSVGHSVSFRGCYTCVTLQSAMAMVGWQRPSWSGLMFLP